MLVRLKKHKRSETLTETEQIANHPRIDPEKIRKTAANFNVSLPTSDDVGQTRRKPGVKDFIDEVFRYDIAFRLLALSLGEEGFIDLIPDGDIQKLTESVIEYAGD